MDGSKVIPFPKIEKTSSAKVLYLKLAEKAYILDLTEQRKRIQAMQKEVSQIKRKLLMRLVEDANNEGPPHK